MLRTVKKPKIEAVTFNVNIHVGSKYGLRIYLPDWCEGTKWSLRFEDNALILKPSVLGDKGCKACYLGGKKPKSVISFGWRWFKDAMMVDKYDSITRAYMAVWESNEIRINDFSMPAVGKPKGTRKADVKASVEHLAGLDTGCEITQLKALIGRLNDLGKKHKVIWSITDDETIAGEMVTRTKL